TGQGRAKLLDFQAPLMGQSRRVGRVTPCAPPYAPNPRPGAHGVTRPTPPASTEALPLTREGAPGVAASPQEFLLPVWASLLSGEIPLPLHARAILESLRNGGELTNIVAELKNSLSRP